ncbi:hypothetical protein T07_2797 [Trichinella nelsoni]|uniref:Uncharacterized protein n=1 Tax=Trichinella nelsoni TaxID=6336 RepID=A0A0V0RB35_9BILA|nr:hypothetical protein T07_2797 [Trichinella nelsoni]
MQGERIKHVIVTAIHTWDSEIYGSRLNEVHL